uniref:Candidate secreted effector n=1 Tax=Meloidogyne incognita TaxID=6306 RepID=A0A914NW42_MELIC
MYGWMVCSGEYGRSMEAVETRRCVLHGGWWCSAWRPVLLLGGCLLFWPTRAKLLNLWPDGGHWNVEGVWTAVLNMVGQWRIMGPGVVFFNFFPFFLKMSSWWLACSWWWFGERDLGSSTWLVYMAGGLVYMVDWWMIFRNSGRYGMEWWMDGWINSRNNGWTSNYEDVSAMDADLCFMAQGLFRRREEIFGA